MTQPQPLTFEEFVERVPIEPLVENDPGIPRYNNFNLHFDTVGIGQFYRTQQHFQRFQRENPDLEKRLSKYMAERDKSVDSRESFKPFERDMYEAYLIMSGYEGISDKDLFT